MSTNYGQGDLLEPLSMTLTINGAAFVLNGGTDTLSLRWKSKTFAGVDQGTPQARVPTIVDAATGQITYAFVAGDTDLAGMYFGQVTVTRSGKPISFPDDGTYFQWFVNAKI